MIDYLSSAASRAESVRRAVVAVMGDNLSNVKPGSEQTAKLKKTLLARGAWSQYLEVGMGPDAEIFTKSQPMSAVGIGAEVGIRPGSHWNNPEPEIVLAVDSRGRVRGASEPRCKTWPGVAVAEVQAGNVGVELRWHVESFMTIDFYPTRSVRRRATPQRFTGSSRVSVADDSKCRLRNR